MEPLGVRVHLRDVETFDDLCLTAPPPVRSGDLLASAEAGEVACEDVQGEMRAWLRPLSNEYSDRLEGRPADLFKHLVEDRRHAVAHAVRDPDKPPDLDPNDPAARERFWADCRVLTAMTRQRVEERWGRDAVRGVPNL